MQKSPENALIPTPTASSPSAPILKPAERRKLTICDGNKGGVGKSLLATTIASLLMLRGETITLVEADQTNPDIARRFKNHAPVLLADVSDRDGWFVLLEALESCKTHHVVMSLPAGLNEIAAIKSVLQRTLETLNIDLQLVFCLSRQHDSIELMRKSLESGLAEFATQGIAIKNGFFGRDEQFDRWHQSPVRIQWQAKGFSDTYLPELNHRLVDTLESTPQALHHLLKADLTTALRLDLEDWLQAASQCLQAVLPLPISLQQAA